MASGQEFCGNCIMPQEKLCTEERGSRGKRIDKALHGFMGLHHDTGFMWLHSAVADYRLTGSEESKVRGIMAANVLAGRYNPKGGIYPYGIVNV